MAKAALALVGIAAAVGIGLAIKHADAANRPNRPLKAGDRIAVYYRFPEGTSDRDTAAMIAEHAALWISDFPSELMKRPDLVVLGGTVRQDFPDGLPPPKEPLSIDAIEIISILGNGTDDDVIVPTPDPPPTSDPGPSSPPGQPSGGDTPGPANGAPLILNPLDPLFPFPNPGGAVFQLPIPDDAVWPAPFDKMSLLGLSKIEYRGVKNFGPENVPFAEWLSRGQQIVPNDSMPDLWIWVSIENPNDWISAFRKYDPPGSQPPSRFIEYQVSPTSSNQAWMHSNILKR